MLLKQKLMHKQLEKEIMYKESIKGGVLMLYCNKELGLRSFFFFTVQGVN